MNSDISILLDFISYILITIGLWKIFEKCGAKKYYALIPVYRVYIIAICADRKDAGRVWFIIDLIRTFFSIISIILIVIFDLTGSYKYGLEIITYALGLTELLYEIKIYSNLCEIFNRKKWWVVLFVLRTPAIIIWGLNKKYLPQSTIQDRIVKAASVTNKNIESCGNGLSINIKERVVKSLSVKKVLLRDIHMHITPGKMVLLLGGSGAGKTTFLNAVTGYEKANATITLNGKNIYKDYESIKYDIGFVPQQDLIRYNDSVLKTVSDCANLKLPLSINKETKNNKIKDVLNIFGLTAVQNNMVSKQSGGQKKRISIATEFISDPYLFILDEPDSGLDGVLARDLMKRLHDISREGKIVIVITHSPDRVADLFDDVIILAKDAERTGRLVFYGEIEKAKSFFGTNNLEHMVRMINRKEEGGEGLADELIEKYGEIVNA